MKAHGLYCGKYVNIERREIELGPLGPNEAIVAVKACGVCGTDLNNLKDWAGEKLRPMGHEHSGIVIEVGSSVKNVKVGAKVVAEDLVYCGVCKDCQEGNVHLCRNMLSSEGRPGMADYFKIDARCLVPFDGLSFEAAALTEPLAVGVCATEAADIPLGASVLIYGDGPVGLFSARCAVLRGAGEVSIVGWSRATPLGTKRLEVAEKLGCVHAFESANQDVVAEVRKLYPKGVDRVIVTSPPKTVPNAIRCAHFGGRVSVLGIDFGGREKVELDVNYIVFNKIGVQGFIAEPALRFNTCLDLLKTKKVDPDLFLTHPCTDADIAAVLKDVIEGKVAAIKPYYIPNA